MAIVVTIDGIDSLTYDTGNTDTVASLITSIFNSPDLKKQVKTKIVDLFDGISGIDFYAADVGKFLKEHPEFNGKIATIILDPPRAGIAPKTLQKTIDLGAENIVYISCNPSTQARDTDLLRQAGYELEKFSLVDQFPHTGHIESIAKFKKK